MEWGFSEGDSFKSLFLRVSIWIRKISIEDENIVIINVLISLSVYNNKIVSKNLQIHQN